MTKGISPLVASVLLIAITMAVAAILANYVSTTVRQQTQQLQATCIGASINYVTADYPKWDSGKIKAVVEAQFAPLGSFKFDVIFDNDTAKTYSITDEPSGGLSPGTTASITSTSIGGSSGDIRQVRISTNCTNVKTDWSALK